MDDFTGEGMVWLEGESWAAMSKVPIQKDQEVVVTRHARTYPGGRTGFADQRRRPATANLTLIFN